MESHLKKAIALQRKGDLKGAIAEMHQALRGRVRHAPSYQFLAALEAAGGQLDAARESLQRALELEPERPEFWFSLGNLENKRGCLPEAVEAYQRCLHYRSDHPQAKVNLALLLQRLERWDEALELAKKAVGMAPKEVKAWLALTGTLGFLRRFEEGLMHCEYALKHLGEQPELLHMRGNLQATVGDAEQAEQCYRRALELAPDAPAIRVSLGDLLAQSGRARDAIPLLQQTLEQQPGLPDVAHRLGTAYLSAGFPADAVQTLLPVVQQHPERMDAFDGLILAAHYLEDTDEHELFELHRQWAAVHAQPVASLNTIAWDPAPKRLRVGFVSPDFRNHSVSRFMTPLLRHLPGAGAEVICYSDVKRTDSFTERLQAIGAEWVYCNGLTDEALAQRIRDDAIDVLVDLAGHTGNHRLRVFACQPAPLQVSWLGYPNTTGLTTIAYRLTDSIADPSGRNDVLSTEKLVRLPDGFHCFEAPLDLPKPVPTPALQAGFVTFGSFNNQAKINALTLRRWKLVLDAVPGSRLLLKNQQLSDARNREHWNRVLQQLGLELERVEMIGFQNDLEAHYRSYERVDIALDTFPYNGTTTTCEALWMAVPVLTIAGDTQRSRTGASLLTHAGLADWIARDEAQFAAIAQRWAGDVQALNTLRLNLREKVQTSTIGDGPAFAAKFLKTLQQLWQAGADHGCRH